MLKKASPLRCYQDDNSVGNERGPRRDAGPAGLAGQARRWFRQMRPRGPAPAPLLLSAVAALIAVAGFYFFSFRVNPDEVGIVLRFGKPARQEPPGLHFRLPYPIDEVLLPKVTRRNVFEVGVRALGGGAVNVRAENAILTGDENIIDVGFAIFWHIEDPAKYLFNIQNPRMTVQDVAESAVRETAGQSEIRPLLTSARQLTEDRARKLMQDTLDHYGSGIHVDQVRLQRVDPPAQIIDAFRDVQAAATDKERLRNEAEAYANRVVPEARGEAARILQGAMAYREQSVAEARGQTARFLKIYDEYRKAPEVTRKRMYLETMERIMSGTDKIIIDGKFGQGGALPLLPLGFRQTKISKPD
jgi:membrane protease subunit HflK